MYTKLVITPEKNIKIENDKKKIREVENLTVVVLNARSRQRII